jgi:membrane-bound metal-dependent hydrolase YbcI (DUF457 family)
LDNVTHTLFAATLARTPLGRAGRGTTAALIIASNIPDVDIVTTAGGAIDYLRWHRGPTHGPIGIIGLGVATAVVVTLGYRLIARLKPRAPSTEEPRGADGARGFSRASDIASFPMLVVVSIIGVLLHVLMDLPTSYGTRLLSPFDWHWFAVDWMPIIDIWLLIVLAAGLIFGSRSPAARRWNAVIVLVFMAANYGLRAASHRQALAVAPRLLGPTLPQACSEQTTNRQIVDVWPRPPVTMPTLAAGKRCLVEIAAIPTFVSPFTWRVVAQMSNAYELYDLNLLDARVREASTGEHPFWRHVRRFPNVWTPAVQHAAAAHTARVYLGFARFPAVRTFTEPDGVTTVQWEDMRFVMAPVPRGDRRSSLFTVTVGVDADGKILSERLGQ